MSTDINNFPPKFKNLPNLNLGDLNGPDGNVFMVMAKVSKKLKEYGYQLESEEFSQIIHKYAKSYEAAFEVISHFLDITASEEVVDFDEEYIYLKVKRTDVIKDNKNNIPSKLYSSEHLEDLIDEGYDIEQTNIYGRNLLYYNNIPSILHSLHSHGIDLFKLDNFNSNPILFLEPTTLNEYLQLMINEDKTQTINLVNQKDKWGRLLTDNLFEFFEKALKEYDNKKTPINQNLIDLINSIYDNNLITNSNSNFLDNSLLALKAYEKKMLDEDMCYKLVSITVGEDLKAFDLVMEKLQANISSKNAQKLMSLLEKSKLEKSVKQSDKNNGNKLKI